ncbi:GNAT family N-acetyltransferase [Pigmentibacter sp. JX0631]|uniref:GNAT family N-acetyltransferase n=1 Tax=Pigmentibacter sp. JX0631 TaxID=2976982 RepID=UPI002468D5C4|nr:GNAT family N-acetyltransferase [Pigmentibacter sp. JX0631]WGL60503.1 GNAT family N-acetyltransferase [Pigmentibacter sp. JX0631]
MQNIIFRETTSDDSSQTLIKMKKHWGGEPLVIRTKNYYPSKLNGIIAQLNDTWVGFLFYDLQGDDCEIVVFEVFEKFKGIGTQIIARLKEIAKNKQCKRIYLMTHNDNLDALRFYQTRGFHICGIHLNSMEFTRKIKPCPEIGDYGIPIRDEIDLEILL